MQNAGQSTEVPLKNVESSQYWDSISQTFTIGTEQTLWRSYSDQINISLLKAWLDNRRFSNLLKTDLFDESVSQGLYPFLNVYADVVHGIDIAPQVVDRAKKRFPELQAICTDIRDLSFNDNRFDLIVSNSTLDHFQSKDEIKKGLLELFRVLKPGGELHISLDNLQNPVVGLRSLLPHRLLKSLRLVPYFVGKTYTRRGLTLALEKAGFRILETRAIMHCPRILAVAVAGMLQKRASNRRQQGFLSMLARFECLARLPTRFFTGHYVAVRALKPISQRARQ